MNWDSWKRGDAKALCVTCPALSDDGDKHVWDAASPQNILRKILNISKHT